MPYKVMRNVLRRDLRLGDLCQCYDLVLKIKPHSRRKTAVICLEGHTLEIWRCVSPMLDEEHVIESYELVDVVYRQDDSEEDE